jgi:RHS repeat-associated protein
MGRVIEETDVLSAQTSLTRTRTFDAAGNLVSSTDEQGNTTSFEYDDLNRLIKTIRPDLNEIIRTYDNRNNLVMLQDPINGMQYFTYDRNNRMLSSAKPMGEQTTYEYDAVGNKTAVVDAENNRIEYTYNAANRMTQVRYYKPSDMSTPVKTVNFTHDKLGNMLTWNDGTSSSTYTYDDLSRKLTEEVDNGTFTLSHAYTYYANGAKKTFTGPDGNTITYNYDEGNRLAGIAIPTQGQVSYTYSPVGNITSKNTEHGEYTYAYDNLYRMTTALNPTLSDEAYTYDNLGNRTTDVKITGQITYNANNELETLGNTSYAYNANGNMTQKTAGTDVTSFFYNIEDRLEHLENGSGEITASYGYDPFGRRLWKEVEGTKTYFHYSNEGLIGEYDQTGAEIKTYGYRPGSTWTTDPLFLKIGTEYYWYQNDHAGTPQKLVATNGLVVWDGVYDAFGNCQINIEGITNNLRFAGQYFDDETGLHYNLNRYYDPVLGRYLRADPFGDGLNLYAYCFNNPNSLIDPLGLCAYNKASGWVHGILAGLGMIPAIGIIPDFIDAALCLLEGDMTGASLSGLAMIPGAGQGSRAAQYGSKLFKPFLKKGSSEFGNTFQKLLKEIKTSDFSTSQNGAVFWTGYHEGNFSAATVWAKATEKKTIGMTSGGQWLEKATYGANAKVTSKEAEHLWRAASAKFASSASGKINAFTKGTFTDTNKVFYGLELKLLKKNMNVNSKITYRGY